MLVQNLNGMSPSSSIRYDDDNNIDVIIRSKRATPRAIGSFVKSLKNFIGIGKNADNLVTSLKNVDSGIKSLDDALRDLPVTKSSTGHLTVAGEPLGSINKVLREGDLVEIVRLSGKQIPITAIEKANFKTAVAEFPEKAIRDVLDNADVTKIKYPQLNVNIDNINLLPDSAKQIAAKVESNLGKYFKVGAFVTLFVGGIVVSKIWLEKATLDRKGCWMLRTVNGKTSSCKVVDYSCNASNTTMACTVSLSYYNVTLTLMKICTLDDTNVDKVEISKLTGIAVNEMNDKLATLIDQHFEKISTYIDGMSTKPVVDVCKITHPSIEDGTIPNCRLCVPSANPTSTRYIDPTQYADNVTFECVDQPTIIDTIADIVVSTGKNLWDGVTGSLSGVLKPILIAVGVILVLIIIISIITRFMPKKKAEDVSTSTQSLFRSQSIYSLNDQQQ